MKDAPAIPETSFFDAFAPLRAWLPLLVVSIHVPALMTQGNAKAGLFSSWMLAVSRLAVPSFFVLSGLLFFRHPETWSLSRWKGQLFRRLRTLFVPLLLWNALSWMRLALFPLLRGDFSFVRAFFGSRPLFLAGWVFGLAHFNPDFTWTPQSQLGPMWFVRDLLVLALLSPLLFFLIRRAWWLLLPVLAACFLSEPTAHHAYDSWRVSAFFFSLGAACSIHGIDVVRLFRKMPLLPLFAAWVVSLAFSEWSRTPSWAVAFPILSGTAFAFALSVRVGASPPGAVVKFLAEAGFFVYCAHPVLNLLPAERLPFSPPTGFFAALAAWSLAYLALFLPALAAYAVLRRFASPVLALLTGRPLRR